MRDEGREEIPVEQTTISSQLDTYRWAQDRLGDGPAYPGHPLVLSTIIMHAFDSMEAADKRTIDGWSAALADCRIPGAGDHVEQAMRILRMGRDGATPDEMIAAAHRYWTDGKAGGHVTNVALGNEQAAKIEQLFRSKAATWLCPPSVTH